MSKARIEQLKADMDAIKAEIQRLAKDEGIPVIRELFQPLFDLGIQRASWAQYTPYFNDGEPCEFSVYAGDDELLWPGGFEGTAWDMEYYSKPYKGSSYMYGDKASWEKREAQYRATHEAKQAEIKALNFDTDFIDKVGETWDDISTALRSMEDMLLAAFGDHAKITVTPDGVEVNEHEHD